MMLQIDQGIKPKPQRHTGRKYFDPHIRLSADVVSKSIKDYHILIAKAEGAWEGEKEALLSEARCIEKFLRDPTNPFVTLLELNGHNIDQERIDDALSTGNAYNAKMAGARKTRKDYLG